MSRLSEAKSLSIQRRFLASPAGSSYNGTGSIASGSKTGSVQLPSSFELPTNVSFGKYPALHELIKPIMSDAGLEYILEAFKFSDNYSVSFDKNLKIHGLTIPGEDPQIGPAAFEKFVVPPMGISIELDDDVVALQVALTIAHECSHVEQLESFTLLDLLGKDKEVARSGSKVASIVSKAKLDQTNILETLGYHSEVYNLAWYSINTDPPHEKKEQLRALRDIAVSQRDFHFNQLPYNVVEVLLAGELKEALSLILIDVPIKFLSSPGQSL
ncbi:MULTISPECIES: hypothetical protein [Pseudomonas]|uniref:Uncharacterized protein n=1 Tax=Pseudomonas wuhanensis TaxID=2954098 RepID=A0ABY9GLS2_9PSED|nr:MULTISPECIES: hypothetical protein [unclassified Pseudomonas]WLI10776.1 hypothetical protein PSH65_21665 [Pseudomonas sp. FP603]WLI16598.1 hypothetical protein PSH88_20295 [Pseudomonas sp. FP607]